VGFFGDVFGSVGGFAKDVAGGLFGGGGGPPLDFPGPFGGTVSVPRPTLGQQIGGAIGGIGADIAGSILQGALGGGGGGGPQFKRAPTSPTSSGGPGGTLPPTSSSQTGGALEQILLPPSEAGFGSGLLELGAGLAGSAFESLTEGSPLSIFGDSQIQSVRGRASITPRESGGGVRLPATVTFAVPTPSGGTRMVTYRNMGRPILYTGDLAAVRRVNRVASRARRRRGGR